MYDTERSGCLEFETVFGTELPHAIIDRSLFDAGLFLILSYQLKLCIEML